MEELDLSPKTVDEYLNECSYDDDKDYIPSEFALKFVSFIKLVNGREGESNKTPVLHYRMLDKAVSDSGKDLINLVHRGAAKTTLLGEYLFLYLAVFGELDGFGKVPFAIYVSDSIDNGVKNMRKNLEYRRANSDFLMEWIPEAKFNDITWEFTNKVGNKLVVKGYGAKTGVRGAKALGKRPVLAVLDDLISDEDARSPTVIASVEDTVYKAIDYALDPTRRKIIWSGTPFNAKDPLYKAVESGAWEVNVYPVCERFPCSKEEFRGSWEDRFTYEFVKKQYEKAKASGKIDTFNQELMLRIMSDDDRLIFDSDIQWYSRRELIQRRGQYNFYITTDFATSEKTSADFSVISVWAINNKGYWFYVDGICARQTMDKNIDDLFRLVQEYQPQSVGIEVTGQQGGFIPWIQDEMMKRNIFFDIASESNSGKPGIRPTTQKFTRFMTVLPWFKQKIMFFPREMENEKPIIEAMNELTLAAKGGFKAKHDDFIDTISMLALLKVWKPSEEASIRYDAQNDIWAPDEIEDLGTGLDSYVV